MRAREAFNMNGTAEVRDPINSTNAIVRDGLTWTARQRRFNMDGPAEAV